MKRTKLFKSLLVAAALCVGASAWAYDVPTGMEVKQVLIGTLNNGNVDAMSFDQDGDAVPAFSNAAGFTITDALPTDVWSGLTLNMSGKALRIGSRSAHELNFSSVLNAGKVVFSSTFYPGTHAKIIKFIDENNKVIAYFSYPDKSTTNGRVYGQQYFFIGEDYANSATLTGSYAINDTYQGTRNREYQIEEVVIDLDAKTISYSGKVMDRRKINNKTDNYYEQCVDNATITFNDAISIKGIIIDATSVANNTYYGYFDNMKLYNVGVASGVSSYTINYKYNGETVATETNTADVGSTVHAQTSVWDANSTQKYYVADGETTSFNIVDGTNVFDVNVRKAEVWTYYVKAYEGSTELMTISTNTIVEGEEASYGYPQYIAVNGVLYKSTAQSGNSWWGESYTITENNSTRGFQYAKEGNESIVFCSEAEDIPGLTVVSGGNTDRRASNRKGAYATAETTITTLEPGIYRVFGATYGNAGTTFTLKAGDATVFTVSTNGNPTHTIGDAFLITETTDLVMPIAGNGGSSPKIMDYIIVQRAGEYYESMSIVGEFSSWDADKGIAMTRNADNPFEWTAEVKDIVITSAKYFYEYKAVGNMDYNVYQLPGEGNQNYNFDYDGARDGKYTLTFTVNTQSHSVGMTPVKQPTATIYFINTNDWTAENIKVWVWDETNNKYNYTGGEWPGQTMTATGEQVDGKDVYSWSTYDITGTPTTLIISNNGSDTDRTGDQPFVNGATYKADGSSTFTKIISAAGYATFSCNRAVDFTNNTGLTAYIAKKDADNENKVVFTPVTKVPANTGVLLKGDAGEYIISSTFNEVLDDVTGNVLKGVNVDTKVPAGSFVLLNGAEGVGFYMTTKEFTVGANTAYIEALSTARFIGFDFEESTGIEGVAAEQQFDGQVYDLQGRRVTELKHGLYIVNGRKVVVK